MSTNRTVELSTSTPIPEAVLRDDSFELVAVDLYRDIHKGIRSELFAITSTAGSIDPSVRLDRAAIADHVTSVAALLASHAHHEDTVIDPVLERHHPDLAERVTDDHELLEARCARLTDLARDSVDAVARDHRRRSHLLHLELSSFTSAYLAHQYLEERVIMPALEAAIGPAEVIGLHVAIVSSIPPDEMARSLAFMLPAMNVDDRVEMLAGIRATAPVETFAGVMDLARSVLRDSDMAALRSRMAL